MTHLVCGYPSIEDSFDLFAILSKYSEFVEVQFPFSDPIADGPIISNANKIALENGVSTEKSFDFVSKIAKENTNILIMTYYNIVLNYWVEKFVEKASKLWVYGLIIPDVPFDEKDGEILIKLWKKYNIHIIQIVSELTKNERLEKIAQISNWFVYAVSGNMTTWSKWKFDTNFENYIKNLRNYFDCKIWVWFWVKTKEDVEKVCKVADFAIIWSEMIRQFDKWWLEQVEKYVKNLLS